MNMERQDSPERKDREGCAWVLFGRGAARGAHERLWAKVLLRKTCGCPRTQTSKKRATRTVWELAKGGGFRYFQGGSQDKKEVASGDAALLLRLSARVEALEAIPPSFD